MIKRYDPNDNGPMRQFVGMDEHEFGDWVKFDEVEASLNFAQQLKAEILPLIGLLRYFVAEGKGDAHIKNTVDAIAEKLSAV